jgi:hypothetical protein
MVASTVVTQYGSEMDFRRPNGPRAELNIDQRQRTNPPLNRDPRQ